MFTLIDETPLPKDALLRRFDDSGDHTDCFVTRINADVSIPEYVEAFYTTAAFKKDSAPLFRGWRPCEY